MLQTSPDPQASNRGPCCQSKVFETVARIGIGVAGMASPVEPGRLTWQEERRQMVLYEAVAVVAVLGSHLRQFHGLQAP